MATNPICQLDPEGDDPLLELKQGLVLYVESAPGPTTARLVYDYYLQHHGKHVEVYTSTSPNSGEVEWTPQARTHFENHVLPDLRKRDDWGYVFGDENPTDSWLFMFHGYRPKTEAGRASFYRFDFPWDVDPQAVRVFAEGLIALVPCLSGFGGYYFQGQPGDMLSYGLIYGAARRYWGIEAHELDVTVNCMLDGFKCVNWLTVIGDKFRQADPAAIAQAKAAAYAHKETPHATLFQAEAMPRFGDRHRNEQLNGYVAVAQALMPLQVKDHPPFSSLRWEEDDMMMRYLRRFTHPQQF